MGLAIAVAMEFTTGFLSRSLFTHLIVLFSTAATPISTISISSSDLMIVLFFTVLDLQSGKCAILSLP